MRSNQYNCNVQLVYFNCAVEEHVYTVPVPSLASNPCSDFFESTDVYEKDDYYPFHFEEFAERRWRVSLKGRLILDDS